MKKLKFFTAIGLILLMAFPAWATVLSETTRVKYTCNGTTTVYAYPFKIYEDDDLLAIKALTATGAETTLVLNTDYTVSGAGVTGGGNLTLTSGSVCPSGYTMTILRNVELTQETDYVDGQAFSAESLENAIDKTALIQQQQAEAIGRAPKLPKTSSIADIALPNPAASHYIGWNAGATQLENKASPVALTTATQYEIDALVTYGGGTSFPQATIPSALTAIGTTNKVTLLLRPGTWVISSNADWSAYTNVTFKIVPGAMISHGTYTLNIPNPDVGSYQWLTGTGLVSFSGIKEVYPEWWGAIADNSTNSATAIQASLDTGKPVKLAAGIYRINSTLTLDTNDVLGGAGKKSTIINYNGTGVAIQSNQSVVTTDVILRDFTLANIATGTTGMKLGTFRWGEMSDVWVYGFSGAQVALDKSDAAIANYFNTLTRVMAGDPYGVTGTGTTGILLGGAVGGGANANWLYSCEIYHMAVGLHLSNGSTGIFAFATHIVANTLGLSITGAGTNSELHLYMESNDTQGTIATGSLNNYIYAHLDGGVGSITDTDGANVIQSTTRMSGDPFRFNQNNVIDSFGTGFFTAASKNLFSLTVPNTGAWRLIVTLSQYIAGIDYYSEVREYHITCDSAAPPVVTNINGTGDARLSNAVVGSVITFSALGHATETGQIFIGIDLKGAGTLVNGNTGYITYTRIL